MANNLNPDSLEQIIDEVKKKRMKANYGTRGTTAGHIKMVIIADVYSEILRYIGLSEYDGNSSQRIKDRDSRRMTEIVDMVERHWDEGACLPEHLLNGAIKEAIEHARKKGELKDAPKQKG